MKNDEESFAAWMQERREEPTDDGRLLEGTFVDGYRIESLLGKGGFAEVYRAVSPTGERVAIKILHRLDEQSRMRFERESHILSQIHHPNTPRLISFGSCGNRPYLVTELLHAEELPHSDRKVAWLVKKVCTAVAALHKLGYAHRDIKPSNILWRDEEPVLIDYGLACPFSDGPVPPSTLSIVDGRRIVVGTAGYAAPEQFSGGEIDEATDVHALGRMVDECFGGKPPRCWVRIIRHATTSVRAQRYESVSALVRAIDSRHRLRTWGLAAIVMVCSFGLLFIGGRWLAESSWERRMTAAGVLFPPDHSFTISPLDETPLMALNELGVDGWGMGDAGDGPVVFVQKLAYSGDFSEHREFQRCVGAVYGGETIVCEDEITNRVLRVEIDHWHEGTNDLYLYRKLFLVGDIVWQVTGQTQMKTKDRDRDKLKSVVDSFRER